jgi:queuine tRNA-ribosyltransferase accessory subunit
VPKQRTQRPPPIYQTPLSSKPRLHAFTSLPSEVISILAPRRHPAAAAKLGNGKDYVSVFAVTGFQRLTTAEYRAALDTLRPDLAIPMADLNYDLDAAAPSSKRAVRMAERTEDWVSDLLQGEGRPPAAVFAPTLPVPHATQWQYLNRLVELKDRISGLAVYNSALLPELSDYPALELLPRLSLSPAASPNDILRDISRGADLFLLPFVNAASDAGVALTFTFPLPQVSGGTPLPLGYDVLADPANATSLEPLESLCACYACRHHHRAYLHHLLNAKEMLAWTLLQLHNHAVLQAFFRGVRASIDRGSFEADCAAFRAAYELELPDGTAIKPRSRGYHVKGEFGDEKLNQKAWGRLDEVVRPHWEEVEDAVAARRGAQAIDENVEDGMVTTTGANGHEGTIQ